MTLPMVKFTFTLVPSRVSAMASKRLDRTLYLIAIEGTPYNLDDILALRIASGDQFTLKPIGAPGNPPMDGTKTTGCGLHTNATYFPENSFESLKFGGPEDGIWDYPSGFENKFYLATKGGYFAGSSVNGLNVPARLYKLEFDNITDPTLG
jgi:hypothetical protein